MRTSWLIQLLRVPAQRKFDRRNCLMQGRSETGMPLPAAGRGRGKFYLRPGPGPGVTINGLLTTSVSLSNEILNILHDFTLSPDQLSFSTHSFVTSSPTRNPLTLCDSIRCGVTEVAKTDSEGCQVTRPLLMSFMFFDSIPYVPFVLAMSFDFGLKSIYFDSIA